MPSNELADELSAIEAIYPDALTRLTDSIVELIIPDHEQFKVRLSFNDEYPQVPPNILIAESVRNVDKSRHEDVVGIFQTALDVVFEPGMVCVFDYLMQLGEVLSNYEQSVPEVECNTSSGENEKSFNEKVPLYFSQSDPIVDRGSTFIGFACEVHSDAEVEERLQELRSVRRIARSTHSMCAWRIKNPDGTIIKDSDDDGETAAGSRMLHLMTLMDVWNCLVVDVRWFGGIHLGPDRFKHINSTSREAMIRGGFAKANT